MARKVCLSADGFWNGLNRAARAGILIAIMTDTVSDKIHAEQPWSGASFDAPAWLICQDQGFQTQSLLNTKCRGMSKALPDKPRKGKALLIFWAFLKGFSEPLDSGEFWLYLRVCSWRQHRNHCRKTVWTQYKVRGVFLGLSPNTITAD